MGGIAVSDGFHLDARSVLSVPQSTSWSLSRRLVAHRLLPSATSNTSALTITRLRGSITRPVHLLSTLDYRPSRFRTRRAAQDSLPAGGQP